MKGKRVLVVEDEPLVAIDVVDILEQAEAVPIGPASNAEAALTMIENENLDAALLDANLGGKPVDEIAAALTRRNIPFAFVTGYGRANLPQAFRSAALVSKPFSAASILEVIGNIAVRREGKVVGIRGSSD